MITSTNFIMNCWIFNKLNKSLTYNKIIKSPTQSLWSHITPGRPKRKLLLSRIEMSKSINKPVIFQQVTKILSLLRCESWNFLFAMWIININILMRDIQISRQNDRFFLIKLFQILFKIFIPFLSPIIEPPQALPWIRDIHSYQIKPLKLRCEQSAFLIMLWNLHIKNNLNRLDFGKDRDSRVAFLVFATVPILLITCWDLLIKTFFLDFFWVAFCFIQT